MSSRIATPIRNSELLNVDRGGGAVYKICGCDAHSSLRKAVAIDPEIKSANLKRLRRIEGQIRGLHKMVEEDCYCTGIIVQISSVQETLRGIGRALRRNHFAIVRPRH